MAVKKTDENFYRRKPRKMLRRLMGMSLEEGAIFNILIDLMYDTWRPLPDHDAGEHAWIVGWCRCAAQKANPILRRLEEKGHIKRVTIDGREYLTDVDFEAEYQEVKVPKKLAKVAEKSGEVVANSGEVAENSPLLYPENKQNQSLVETEKSKNKSKTRDREKEKIQKEKGPTARPWPGDPAVRSAVAGDGRYGDDWCVSYLDRSTIREDGAVVAWSGNAFEQLRRCDVLKGLGVVIAPP